MRTVLVLLAVGVLAACGRAAEPTEPPNDQPGVLASRATVVETESGTLLCEGEIRESAPPQCEGPVIDGWDWEAVWHHGTEGGRWGEFCVEGTRADDRVTVTAPPMPADACGALEYEAQGTVLENAQHGPQACLGAIAASAPPQCGGPDLPGWEWQRVGGFDELNGTTSGSYALWGIWRDGDFVLSRRPVSLALYDPIAQPTPTFPAPSKTVERAELERISDEVIEAAGPLFLYGGPDATFVGLHVVVDVDGELQKRFDEEHGVGLVHVTSALRPVAD